MKRLHLDVVDDKASDFAYPIDSTFLPIQVCKVYVTPFTIEIKMMLSHYYDLENKRLSIHAMLSSINVEVESSMLVGVSTKVSQMLRINANS